MIDKKLHDFAELLIDSYFVIDLERNIVDFNRAFYSMLPRSVARRLKTKKCYEVLRLGVCEKNCIAQQCWATNKHVRLDEITGTPEGTEDELRFILSAIPLHDDAGNIVGAVELQRNVTDEAMVQVKYQQQLEASTEKLEGLKNELQDRTKRLVETGRQLAQYQVEYMRSKTELLG